MDKLTPVKFIIGGVTATKGEFPWQGLLVWKDNTGGTFLCGATLIGKNYAMTAAHCAEDMRVSNSHLQFGIIDSEYDTTGVVRISQKFIHPNYISTDYEVHNDIAILKLSTSVGENTNIKTIALPVDDSQMITGTGIVTGWGNYYYNGQISKDPSRFLQQATIDFISPAYCK
uniref:Peptidase S1 domain-containing protein n=1 Tax=Acrobeloides nanus TaxID=290746 RepID=A0A914DVT6_9BILA